jgi:hypothetical protein
MAYLRVILVKDECGRMKDESEKTNFWFYSSFILLTSSFLSRVR